MARIILFLAVVILFASIALGLKTWNEQSPVSQDAANADSSGLVALQDGSTMIAAQGTVGRDLVDWLAESGPGQRSFEFGGQEFVGRSAEPTAESLGRIPRLAAMLRANPDVRAVVVGHADASGDAAADTALSRTRAETLIQRLREAGVSPSRLSVEARGSTEPLSRNDSPAGRARNERVSLILTRDE